jgi:aminopeptidase YwaD
MRVLPFVVPALVLLAACSDEQRQPTNTPTKTGEPPTEIAIALETVKAHVGFLASDEQQGRAPGTESDRRTQDYIANAMKDAGLQPGFGSDYRQPFEVTDGVQLREGGQTVVDVSGTPIPHHLVPYTGDTSQSGPAVAKFIFAGWGIPGENNGPGDFKGLDQKIKGKVVVVLYGGPDPHIDPTRVRPAAKVIAARDRGAVGVVIWDPQSDTPPHNDGEWSDMKIPVLFVGAAGNDALVKAFGGRPPTGAIDPNKPGISRGKVTRKAGTLEADVEPVRIATANVGGVLEGNGSTDEVVVVGAHMDHLGMGSHTSLALGERAIHNGADDNASGVAVMLELCRAMSDVPKENRPYDLFCVAFGAEEMGLLGSKYLVDNMDKVARERIAAMVNFDMVGRLREETVTVAGVGTSSVWKGLVEAHKGALKVTATEDGYGPSDHGSFYEVGIPVLHFWTGSHEDYHKPTDDTDKINFDGAVAVGTMALSIVREVEEKKIAPDYLKTQPSMKQGGRDFRVSLGTMPDYAGGVDGVKLSGVRDGGPAQKAGMQKGDVIKKIGTREIHNLEDYMASFAELVPATAVKVVVERDGKTIEVDLVPAAPRPK